jgi:hypothetical protein
MLVTILVGAIPLSASASSHHTATRAPVSFTSTVVEVVDPGEEWVDEAGIYHLRGLVTSEEVSGDISGTAISTENDDVFAPGECTEESCPHYGEVWGTVEITDENGWWEGRWMLSYSTVPGDEYFFTSVVVHGRGGYAGMSFFGEFTDLAEDSVTIEGTLSSMATPIQQLVLGMTVCFTETGAGGSYLGTGAVDGFGQAEAIFIGSGFQWTHTYNLFGVIELSDESGSFVVGFVGGAQDVGFISHGFGTFVITGGAGAYAELYGNGRVVGSAVLLPQCESGFGARLSLIGEAHYN